MQSEEQALSTSECALCPLQSISNISSQIIDTGYLLYARACPKSFKKWCPISFIINSVR